MKETWPLDPNAPRLPAPPHPVVGYLRSKLRRLDVEAGAYGDSFARRDAENVRSAIALLGG